MNDRSMAGGMDENEKRTNDADELMAAVVAGDIVRNDPRVEALPAKQRAQLDALLRTQARLDEAAEDEQALLAEIERGDVAPTAATPGPRRLASTFWLRAAGIAAMAAGLLLLAQTLRTTDPVTPIGSGQLGSEVAIELLAPRGAVDAFAPFRWQMADAPPLSRFVLLIWDGGGAAPEAGGRPLIERDVDGTQWTPAAGDPPLPDRIAWRVDLRPLDGARQRGPVESAWRDR